MEFDQSCLLFHLELWGELESLSKYIQGCQVPVLGLRYQSINLRLPEIAPPSHNLWHRQDADNW
jgi:hypothetical protein